jgi:hypothetical protein
MNDTAYIEPAKRQVLVNLGNRFVVFGPEGGLPEPIRFDPKASPILPRVPDEGEVAETRIAETLQVSGMTRATLGPERTDNADVELVDANGRRVLVELKVRERDPNERDLQSGLELLDLATSKGEHLEVWFFNLERLKLTMMRRDGSDLRFDNLVPLNVWEKSSEGIFERKRVAEEVDEWLRRVGRLYADVQEWLGDRGDLRFEQIRTVIMSEEIMQRFAVAEIRVLDIILGEQVLASFVPRGLWLIGAWGRVDIITKDKTSILVVIKQADEFEWRLVSAGDRRPTRRFDRAALLELMNGQ